VVIACLNNVAVEVDSRGHEDIDRNEKEESQTLAIFPTDVPRQRFRAHEVPGTPAKAYKRRVTNPRVANHFWKPWPDNREANGCTTLI
jgi:hypothetical protein